LPALALRRRDPAESGHRLHGTPHGRLAKPRFECRRDHRVGSRPFLDCHSAKDAKANVRAVLNTWSPGKFDVELILDGKASNNMQTTDGVLTSTNVPGATLIPPAFGLGRVNLH